MRKWNIGWGTISACNMNCQFCYSMNRRKDSHDLKYEDWLRFIEENHNQINTINYHHFTTFENKITHKALSNV